MAGEFLSNLADALTDQFSLGENNNHTLKLGDFAKRIDQTQQRSYAEQGYLRLDPYNASPKQIEVLFQEPDITVLVKKRAFASLSENFRLDHMDKDEKLFYKATKILFQNKCSQIAALEKLSKINRISVETGQMSAQLIPIIIGLVDNISLTGDIIGGELLSGANAGVETDLGKLKNVIDKVRKVYAYTSNSSYTRWVAANTTLSQTLFGQGTGVLELNNVTTITTKLSTGTNGSIGGGDFTLSISDPYNLMSINNYDIEKALSDATNFIYNKKIFQFAAENLDLAISDAKKKLNEMRMLRGASAIEFIINPDTLLGKKVRAIIDGRGVEINFTYDSSLGFSGITKGGVNISIESLRGGPEVGDEGLDDRKSREKTDFDTGVALKTLFPESEVSLFTDVISKIFNDLQLKANSRSITKQNAELTNYARKKLKLHYGGKLLIQPMDQVHVYISSKARLDNKISGGLQNMFSGLGFLQKLNNTFADFKGQFNSLFNPSGDANIQIEKAVFVGSDFPNWLWTLLRSQFVNDTSGTHVFAGVALRASSTYGDGKYNVNVTGSDNTHYLDMGNVNLKPSLDVFNGPLLDPLTPFKTKFNTVSSKFKADAPELLDENKDLLKASFTKFKAGNNAGKKATEYNIIKNCDHDIQANSGNIRKIFYSPDGFTYRWKEGVGTLTAFSKSFSTGTNSGFPSITKDPFAGQDIMNVISLAVTGIPYNYATFYKAARDQGGVGKDPQTGEDSARSFYSSLTADLKKNNLLWGNFIPFKNLTMDEASYQKVISSQLSILNTNDLIDQKLIQLKKLNNDLIGLSGGRGVNTQDTSLQKDRIQKELSATNKDLNRLYEGVQQQLTNSKQNLSIVGDDVSFNYDEFLNNDSSNKKSLSNSKVRRDLRRKVNFLTRRMAWSVRANEDKNYFIVDDTYDKDFDIAAFEKALISNGDLKLFNSEYSSVKGKIETVAKLLNLEVFCDTQGHIRVRPPQYNRMPSSIFYRLLQLKKVSGIQLFPQFIEDLIEDQLQSTISQIEIIEDQIRLDAATLGKNNDDEIKWLIRGPNTRTGSDFKFLSNDNSDGKVIEIQAIFTEANPDKHIAAIKNNTFQAKLDRQAGLNNVFNAVRRSTFVVNETDATKPAQTFLSSTRIKQLSSRLFNKTGQQVVLDDLKSISFAGSAAQTIDEFKVTKDISIKLMERQKLVKIAANALKNAVAAIDLDADGSSTGTKLLMPDFSKNSEIPELFENMLEDETYDDYGVNAGKRYILKNYQIRNLTIAEERPAFNAVEVKGQVNLNLPNSELPEGLNLNFLGTGEGNGMTTAAAVDYDMWRMYGLTVAQPVAVPFLSNVESQCAPFAAMLLSRARQNILQGTATINGNEFMQPGDVIYLEDKDLLFYVEGVSHNFTYGGSFTTELSLKYGHSPGDYIPTTLDMVGKLLYKNRDTSSSINFRQDTSYPQQPIGTIILDRRASWFSDDIPGSLSGGAYGEHNIQVIDSMLYTSYFAINANKDVNTSTKAQVELRIYYDSKGAAPSVDTSLNEAAQYILECLTGTSVLVKPKSKDKDDAVIQTNLKLSPGDVKVTIIDVSDTKGDHRAPSQKSVDMIRSIIGSTSSKVGEPSKLDSILFGYIIDCWINFDVNLYG